MNLPKVTIQIVTYNNRRLLPDTLRSIFDQTLKDFQVLVIDNGSQDGTVEFIKNNYPEVAVFQNKKNLGFAKANNQGIRLLNSPLVVLCNPDIILEPDWLEKMVAKAERHPDYGSFGGKLLKLEVIDPETLETQKTDIVDSCGLEIFKNHQVRELGVGRNESEFNVEKEIFGVSGALVLYQREALQDILVKTKQNPEGEYFDEDFFFYKEDVDLAWRLRLRDWKSLFVPEVKAYHLRTLKMESASWRQNLKSKRQQSVFAQYHSFRNHYWLLIKDEFTENILKYFFPIFFFELKRFFFALFLNQKLIKAFFEAISGIPKMLKKRKIILSRVRVKAEEIGRWLN